MRSMQLLQVWNQPLVLVVPFLTLESDPAKCEVGEAWVVLC